MADSSSQAPAAVNRQSEQRRTHLQRLREDGFNYPNQFKPTHSLKQALAAAIDDPQEATTEEHALRVAGRLVRKRLVGKSVFAHLQGSDHQLQIYANSSHNGEAFAQLCELDLGDIVCAQGSMFLTRTKERTLRCAWVRLLAKALYPMPDKYHGLQDVELRSRQRYLDLIANQRSRRVFMQRSQIVQGIRQFFNERGFLEVETSQLHPIAGGAVARPFVTHHNALNQDLFLRIAPELYLKRLIVGGLERVFEIGKSFRNEGVSTEHNPEFTMMEFYWSYADYKDAMQLTEQLFSSLCNSLHQTTTLQYKQHQIELGGSYERLGMLEAIRRYAPDLVASRLNEPAYLLQILDHPAEAIKQSWGAGKLQLEVFERYVQPLLIQPTFVVDHPLEVSPLSRQSDRDSNLTERFELFIAGMEVANGFSELNDPYEQRKRFENQQRLRNQQGDDEAMSMDEDYIRALEHAMPPTAGEGIGIDRLVMLLTGCESIREVILFPLLRARHQP